MISIWIFIGLLLIVYGFLHYGQGVVELFVRRCTPWFLAGLRAPLWWGSLLLILGAGLRRREFPAGRVRLRAYLTASIPRDQVHYDIAAMRGGAVFETHKYPAMCPAPCVTRSTGIESCVSVSARADVRRHVVGTLVIVAVEASVLGHQS